MIPTRNSVYELLDDVSLAKTYNSNIYYDFPKGARFSVYSIRLTRNYNYVLINFSSTANKDTPLHKNLKGVKVELTPENFNRLTISGPHV